MLKYSGGMEKEVYMEIIFFLLALFIFQCVPVTGFVWRAAAEKENTLTLKCCFLKLQGGASPLRTCQQK